MQDHEEFSALMDEYGTYILHLTYTFVRNRQTAEDLTQEIFIKCYKNFDTFKGNSNVRTWLYRIAVNHCKDYVKSWHYRFVKSTQHVPDQHLETQQSPESLCEQREVNKRLLNDIFQLPLKYREIILLYYFHELTLKEVSDICSLSISTVNARLNKAKKLLKITMTERVEQDGQTI